MTVKVKQMTFSIFPHRARLKLICLIAGTFTAGVVTPLWATTIQNFDAPGTPFTGANYPAPIARAAPTVAGPDALSTGSYLRLLSGGIFTRTQNGVGFDLSDSGAFNHIIADFDFRITCAGARVGFGGGGCADGFAFLLLDTSIYGTSGATGPPTQAEFGLMPPGGQIALGFTVFGASTATNRVSIQANNVFLAGASVFPPTNTFDLVTGTFGNQGAFHHANIDLLLGGTPTVTVNLTHGVTGNTITPFSNFDLSGTGLGSPVERRVGFVARCGDACADYNIDNVNVQFLDPVGGPGGDIPEPTTLVLLGLGLAGVGFNRKREWFS